MQKRIGDFLVDRGLLTKTHANLISEHGQKNGLRFGDAAVELGLLKREQLIELFGANHHDIDFFNLEVQYLPKETQNLVSPSLLLQLGAIPLGFKKTQGLFRTKKVLNIGVLDPGRQDSVLGIEKAVRERLGENAFTSAKVFLVLAEQFLDVMQEVYGVDQEKIRREDPAKLDGTLTLFLENQAN